MPEPYQKSTLLGMKNVIVSPHVAGHSDIYMSRLLPILRIPAVLKGERRNLLVFIEW
jgi:phosphoglycerate dehydrogenase-like enzyme